MTTRLPNDGGPIDWKIRGIAGEPGKYLVETSQDEAPILDFNQARRNDPNFTGDLTFGRQIASVPFILWNRWIKENPEIKAGKGHPDYEKTLFRLIKENPLVKTNNDHIGRR